MGPLVAMLVVVLSLGIAASAANAGSDPTSRERSEWSVAAKDGAGTPAGWKAFRAECKKTVEKVKATLHAYARTVVTVVKALAKAVYVVVSSIGELFIRLVLLLVLHLGRWLLGALLTA